MEFTDVILISKTGLSASEVHDRIFVILKNLNTQARIVPINKGKINVDGILGMGVFDKAKQASGWLKQLRGVCIVDTHECASVGLFVRLGDHYIPKYSISPCNVQKSMESDTA